MGSQGDRGITLWRSRGRRLAPRGGEAGRRAGQPAAGTPRAAEHRAAGGLSGPQRAATPADVRRGEKRSSTGNESRGARTNPPTPKGSRRAPPWTSARRNRGGKRRGLAHDCLPGRTTESSVAAGLTVMSRTPWQIAECTTRRRDTDVAHYRLHTSRPLSTKNPPAETPRGGPTAPPGPDGAPHLAERPDTPSDPPRPSRAPRRATSPGASGPRR